MPKMIGYKQRRYAEYYDTLYNGVGNVAIGTSRLLFNGANGQNRALSNLPTQGQLPSDNTFVVLALAVTPIHYTLRAVAAADAAAGTTNPTRTAASPVSMSTEDVQWNVELMTLLRKQLITILRVGEKEQWDGLIDSAPAAQGLTGAVSISTNGLSGGDTDIGQVWLNNGEASYEALLRFAKPIVIACRQNFQVEMRFGGAVATQGANPVPDVRNYLNVASPGSGQLDFKHCSARILGLHVRDVE